MAVEIRRTLKTDGFFLGWRSDKGAFLRYSPVHPRCGTARLPRAPGFAGRRRDRCWRAPPTNHCVVFVRHAMDFSGARGTQLAGWRAPRAVAVAAFAAHLGTSYYLRFRGLSIVAPPRQKGAAVARRRGRSAWVTVRDTVFGEKQPLYDRRNRGELGL